MNSSTHSPHPVHVLRTGAGVVIEATLDPVTFQFNCRWAPPPPYSRKKQKRIAMEYIPWRDSIMQEAAMRLGVRVVVVTPGLDGKFHSSVLGVKEMTP